MKSSIAQNRIAILFGGDGYIGRNLLFKLVADSVFDSFIVFDKQKSNSLMVYYERENIEHILGDVRQPIDIRLQDFDANNSWIFNFAAVHREPGHEFHEYFDTNIPGAQNVVEFASRANIKNILFTSSIAPYGKSLNVRTENSNLYPETAYGISKALAEQTHLRWLDKDVGRRLVIVRPSVIFGPNDPGNVYRMIKSLKKGTFILPNGGNIIKAYGYVYGLIESMLFTMEKNESLIIYNYAESPLVPLKEMVTIAKKELNIKKPVLSMSVSLLAMIAFFVQVFFRFIGKKSDIHPVRVRKAGFPTNIKPEYLERSGFNFKYDFQKALEHWKKVSPEEFN